MEFSGSKRIYKVMFVCGTVFSATLFAIVLFFKGKAFIFENIFVMGLGGMILGVTVVMPLIYLIGPPPKVVITDGKLRLEERMNRNEAKLDEIEKIERLPGGLLIHLKKEKIRVGGMNDYPIEEIETYLKNKTGK